MKNDERFERFLRRARARLPQTPPRLSHAQGTPAAVLMALLPVKDEWHLLFTERAATMPVHAGEISFPGGRLLPGEEATHAALREAEEETGLASALVTPLGFSELCRTGSGHVVAPLLAMVAPGWRLRPCPREVAAIFTAPLAYFLKAEHYAREEETIRAKRRSYHVIYWRERRIWGATAAMLLALRKQLA